MSEDHEVPDNHNQNDYPFFEDRVEEPPFVYLGSNHPPDIASEIPGHVYNFEQAWSAAGPVKVFELLGKPDFQNVQAVDDSLLEKELDALLELLGQNNIQIEAPLIPFSLFIFEPLF